MRSPCCHISYTPLTMVVLDARPTTESPISGDVLAMMNTMAAATVRASGRLTGSVGRIASVFPQRTQRALPPGGNSGSRCSRSHSSQATVVTAVFIVVRELSRVFMHELAGDQRVSSVNGPREEKSRRADHAIVEAVG